jgi:hypothetical protein
MYGRRHNVWWVQRIVRQMEVLKLTEMDIWMTGGRCTARSLWTMSSRPYDNEAVEDCIKNWYDNCTDFFFFIVIHNSR